MKTIRYTPQLARSLCARIANGESLSMVCEDPAMPARGTVYRWLETKEKFRTMFSQACGLREDKIFDEILEKADSADASNAHAVRVMVDARKWVLGRMNPTKYGDRQQVELSGQVGVKPLPATPQDAMKEFVELLKIDVEFVSQSIISAGEDYARTVRDRLASALGPGAPGPHEGASHAAVPHVS